MNFTEIANWMNEQGHKTSTGKVFRSGHVHSILKKYRIRILRVEKEATSKLSKFDLYFVDKTLVNQTQLQFFPTLCNHHGMKRLLPVLMGFAFLFLPSTT
jgi:hypothetical protein